MLYQPVSQWHSLYFELLIELVAQKLTELWWFKKLAYFLTWWPSSMTYLFVNVTYWNCSPIPYVDQVWWWYVKAFMSYAWQNWQTNRQTPRQTNILAKNCKFWQVTNRQTNILAKNCKFWQVMRWETFKFGDLVRIIRGFMVYFLHIIFHYIEVLLICTELSMSSRWLLMSWHQSGARPSANTIMTHLWL